MSYCNIISNIAYWYMRLVLDTDTMVAAIRSNAGASRRLIVAGLERKVTLLVSVPLVIEYQAVLTRPAHLAASGLSAEDVSALLDAVVAVAERVRVAYLWRPAVNDPDDEMVLEAAVNGRADAIVTFNARDFGRAASPFGVAVRSPGEMVKRLGDMI